MSRPPSAAALDRHRRACAAQELGYVDPDTHLFVMTSVGLRQRGACCGQGCRHCPFPESEQRSAGRPLHLRAWPWPDPAGGA